MIANEVGVNFRPCLVSGFTQERSYFFYYSQTTNDPGHCWVCDGNSITDYYSGYTYTYKSFYGVISSETTYYSDSKVSLLHMNWGWGQGYEGAAYNNGWYDYSNYTTSPDQNSDNFQYFQEVVYNIHP